MCLKLGIYSNLGTRVLQDVDKTNRWINIRLVNSILHIVIEFENRDKGNEPIF